jgi:hypothetical protein
MVLLKRSFPARTLAAYAGYAEVIYMRMLWKLRKMPGRYRAAPMMGTIQWTEGLEEKPKMRTEAGMKMEAMSPISRRISGATSVLAAAARA